MSPDPPTTLELGSRLRVAAAAAAYAALELPLTLAGVLVIAVGSVLGLVLLPLWVGLPILISTAEGSSPPRASAGPRRCCSSSCRCRSLVPAWPLWHLHS